MSKIIIRQLTKQDYKAVRNVDIKTQKQYLGAKWNSLSDAEKEKHLVSRKSEFDINVNSGYCFVASINNIIVGFLLAYETQPFLKNIYIRYIGINPKYQGQGIGSLIYKRLISKAKKNNNKNIIALINLDNSQSMKLHKKLGFTLRDRKEATLELER
ncbi:GNAT family N-acetyltransferase [Candidatus Daviesbacteria bacterium]|nr:GNAT family N-acetyltransferase [Candidatus Daviesbacteria bacterium]